MSKETIQKDKVDKLQDEFMEFWDSKKDSLGLGEYSDVILQWWLDKISQIEQEKEREFIDLVNNTSDFADSGDTLKQRIINQLNKQNNE